MQFKYYRKTTPTLARPLTQEDYQQRAGIIQTREGPASFRVGDYLALDRAGEYPIHQEMLERNYQYHSSAHGPHEGWNWYHPSICERRRRWWSRLT